jgi:hypothetical protein
MAVYLFDPLSLNPLILSDFFGFFPKRGTA